ncbi:DUF892 family protein [Mucilaginibacter robiniae]|uniref:DUF892 family protein n=1 Tax=Mucilaginibacter robiniae TaxID=2728022 RepID=A0A7L5DW66_9SPHI|nr:DUF892 family protein [Mucilaginibacter robiniae]QJD95335.1 DUF892 family protein [Mucilaginibacter robiniae]
MAVELKKDLSVPDEQLKPMFIKLLNEVFKMKSELLGYLPLMSDQAHVHAVKTAILQCGINIQAQLFRMNIIMALLKAEAITKNQTAAIDLNLQNYIKNSIGFDSPYKIDCSLIMHLIMVESFEITSFRLLSKMAVKLHPKHISHLLKANLLEATSSKRDLAMLLDNYLA